MRISRSIALRAMLLISLMVNLTVLSTRLQADTGICGGVTVTLPFTDVMGNPFFCQIAAAYFSGLTSGTSATTYSPSDPVPREQMAAFVTRTLDQSLRRGSRRAALGQWWNTIPHYDIDLGTVTMTGQPISIQSDGQDLWVTQTDAIVSRVRASDGKLLEAWTGAAGANALLVAMGRVFVTSYAQPGRLYMIDPSQPAGEVTTVASNLGDFPFAIAFDGRRIWTANSITGIDNGSVSIITPGPTLPWAVTTITTGFRAPKGILFDGTNIWVADNGDGRLKRLDSSGSIVQAVVIGGGVKNPIFDGTNIWVPDVFSVYVVRASTGTVLASLDPSGGFVGPLQAAFDGERILVTSPTGGRVVMWKAADLTLIGTFNTGDRSFPQGVCSDGINFWIALSGASKLARF